MLLLVSVDPDNHPQDALFGSNPVRDGPDKSSQSMMLLAIELLPHRICSSFDKNDAVAIFVPPSSSHTISGDFTTIFRRQAPDGRDVTDAQSRLGYHLPASGCRQKLLLDPGDGR